MKSKTDTAPSTGANPSTLTTADDAEYRLSDLAITLENARTVLHALSPADAITAVDSILQGASASLEHVMAAPEAESTPKLAAVEDQPVRPGAILVDERRFFGALRILHDAIVATESTSIEDEGAHRALTVLSDALRDAADPARIGN